MIKPPYPFIINNRNQLHYPTGQKKNNNNGYNCIMKGEQATDINTPLTTAKW